MSGQKGKKKAKISSNWLSIASSVGSKAKLTVKTTGAGKEQSAKHSKERFQSSTDGMSSDDRRKAFAQNGFKIAPSVMQVGRFILRGIDTTKPAPRVTRHVALDCEMVGVGPKDRSVLAQICVVNYDCEVIYSTYVQPQEKVADYRTWVSGVKPEHLRRAPTFAQVQREVGILTEGRIIVGHGLTNDMTVLMLKHPRRMVRDTAKFPAFQWMRGGQRRPKRLMQLAMEYLNMQIQSGEHDPAEDAIAPMRLYRHAARQWEAWLKGGMRGDPDTVPMAAGVAEKRADKRQKRGKKWENRWEELERKREARLAALGADRAKQLAREAAAATEPVPVAAGGGGAMNSTHGTGLSLTEGQASRAAAASSSAPAPAASVPSADPSPAAAALPSTVGSTVSGSGPTAAGEATGRARRPGQANDSVGRKPSGRAIGDSRKKERDLKRKRKRDEATRGVVVDKRLPFKRLQAERMVIQQRRDKRVAAAVEARGGRGAGGTPGNGEKGAERGNGASGATQGGPSARQSKKRRVV